jgi:hypothetical protein
VRCGKPRRSTNQNVSADEIACAPCSDAWLTESTHHAAAVSLYVTHYNLCRVHEALRTTPGVALGIADRVWTIGDLLDATLALEPNRPIRTKRNFTVIEGGKD